MGSSVTVKYIECQINLKAYWELRKTQKAWGSEALTTIRLDKGYGIEMQPYLQSTFNLNKCKQVCFVWGQGNFNVTTAVCTMYKSDMRYRLCLEEDSEEDELHVFEKCSVFHNTSSESDLYIEHVYGTLKQQMAAIKHFLNVIRRRDIYLI